VECVGERRKVFWRVVRKVEIRKGLLFLLLLRVNRKKRKEEKKKRTEK
jgi:hypothetical protein